MDVRALAIAVLDAASPSLDTAEREAIRGCIEYGESPLGINKAMTLANEGRWKVPVNLVGRLREWADLTTASYERRNIELAIGALVAT